MLTSRSSGPGNSHCRTSGGQSFVKSVGMTVLVLQAGTELEKGADLDAADREGVEAGVASTFKGEAGTL